MVNLKKIKYTSNKKKLLFKFSKNPKCFYCEKNIYNQDKDWLSNLSYILKIMLMNCVIEYM